MPFASLIVLKEAFDAVMTAKDLADAVCGARSVEVLQTVADVHADTAARLLNEARDRRGQARRQKFVLAIGQLELLHTALTKQARHTFAASSEQALLDGCKACLTLAAAYRALGNDPLSVEEHLADAKAFYSQWEKMRKTDFFWAENTSPLGHHPIPRACIPAWQAMWREKYRILASERDAVNELAQKISSIGTDPACLGDCLPWR